MSVILPASIPECLQQSIVFVGVAQWKSSEFRRDELQLGRAVLDTVPNQLAMAGNNHRAIITVKQVSFIITLLNL